MYFWKDIDRIMDKIASKFFSLLFFSGLVMITACMGSAGSAGQGPGKIKVQVDSLVDIAKVSIDWVAPNMERVRIVENGRVVEAEFPPSDKDVFEVYVGQKVIGGGGASRPEPGSKNDYSFYISKEKKGFLLDMKVPGREIVEGYYLKRYIRDLVGSIARVEFYDIHGLKTHETYDKLSMQGEVEAENRLDYEYDTQGRKVHQVHTSTTPSGELISKTENRYEYDSEGRETEQAFTSYGSDGEVKMKTINRFRYNDSGLLVEKEFISFGAEGKKASHFITEYLYDEKGYNIEDVQYTGERELMFRLSREFNEEGTIIKEAQTEYNPDGSVKSRHGREYDDRGKVIRSF